MLGYPKLFSEEPTRSGLCLVYEALFDDDERRALNELGMRLNRVIEAAALASDLEYIELSYIFAGHETCASDAWLQFVSADPGFQDGNFHPEADGQLMMARTVACYLTIVKERPSTEESETPVTVPPAGLSAEDAQNPETDAPAGDLGDELYDCATGQQTPLEGLNRDDPPVPELQEYPGAEPATQTTSTG